MTWSNLPCTATNAIPVEHPRGSTTGIWEAPVGVMDQHSGTAEWVAGGPPNER